MILFSILVYNWMVKIIPTEVMLWKTFFGESPCEVIFQVLRQNRLTPKSMIMLLF